MPSYSFARGVSGAGEIAIAGVDAQYPLFGPDLTNHVQARPQANMVRSTACVGRREWRRLLNDGDYDYVVTAGRTADAAEPVEAAWDSLRPRSNDSETGRDGDRLPDRRTACRRRM